MNEYPTLESFLTDPALTSLPRATGWLKGGQATPRPEGLCTLGEARDRSPESDYGVCWTVNGRNWPRWRVTYFRATDEVCALETGGRGHDRVRVLGVVPADEDTRFEPGGNMDGPTYYETLNRILDGYADEPTFDLAWVVNRLADYQPVPARTPITWTGQNTTPLGRPLTRAERDALRGV